MASCGGRTETGAFQGGNAGRMEAELGGGSGCMSACLHDFDASTDDTLVELIVKSKVKSVTTLVAGGLTQPCSCVNRGGCL